MLFSISMTTFLLLLKGVVASPVDTNPLSLYQAESEPQLAAPVSGELYAGTTAVGHLIKRAPILVKKIQATWQYNCPVGGTAARVFQWKATATSDLRSVTLDALMNINKFIDFHTTATDFSAYYVHGFCTPVGAKQCVYKFKGKTVGWVDRFGVHLQMITLSIPAKDNPYVQEECYDMGPGHMAGTCPMDPPDPRPCTVVNVAVSNVP